MMSDDVRWCHSASVIQILTVKTEGGRTTVDCGAGPESRETNIFVWPQSTPTASTETDCWLISWNDILQWNVSILSCHPVWKISISNCSRRKVGRLLRTTVAIVFLLIVSPPQHQHNINYRREMVSWAYPPPSLQTITTVWGPLCLSDVPAGCKVNYSWVSTQGQLCLGSDWLTVSQVMRAPACDWLGHLLMLEHQTELLTKNQFH